MKMKPIENWRSVLKKAWSIRLMLLAAVLSGIEVILPVFSRSMPEGLFAGLSFITVMAAFVARLVAQKDKP